METDYKTLTVKVPAELMRLMKIKCATDEISVRDYITAVMEKDLKAAKKESE